MIKQKFPKKREELENLESKRFDLHMKLVIINSLIAKYSRIARGKKGRGRYKAKEYSYQYYL